jgi:tetratricopeptide (TPR) repeat protein
MSGIDQEYTFAAVARILGLPEAKLRYWSQSGFVGPSRRRGVRQLFTFQDLVTVRAAKELVERGFSPAQIRKALESVRAALPHVDRPLEHLRVAWDGKALTLISEGVTFEVTGQRTFDFGLGDLAARAASVSALPMPKPALSNADGIERSAYQWFSLALAHEAGGRNEEASVAYRHALAADPGLAAAHNNLGTMAYNSGDAGTARAAFEAALAMDPDHSEARYNLARILYELGETELAASELRRVVQTAPDFADAHYNLATALEDLGSQRQAVEHLRRYLDLTPECGEEITPWLGEARARLDRLQP